MPLGWRDEFASILVKEVEARNLAAKDVIACVDDLYSKVYKCTHGNDDLRGGIVVRANKFTDNEHAALVTFLKLQSQWQSPLEWREETSCKERE